ncbi:MAG: [LysW]-lysine hydrolase [Acidobacteriota bacterium]
MTAAGAAASPASRPRADDLLARGPADPARLLYELVSIPSVSRLEARAVRFLVDRFAALGLDATVDAAGNAVGRVGDPAEDAVDVMLLGHIDTVPGGPPPRVEGGRLFGRGAVDAKGPLAVFAAAAARLRAEPVPGLRLTVVGAVEEEVPSSKGARYLASSTPAPDFCIIGEPSGARAVTLGYKGRLLLDLERRRATSHSAGPEPTATEDVVDAWTRIQDLAASWNAAAVDGGRRGIFDQIQTELQSITTLPRGDGGDEDRCVATVGFRLPPELGPGELEAQLRSNLGGLTLGVRGAERAWLGERRGPLVASFSGAIREVAGVRPRLLKKTGTSDMNVVAPVWGCPIVAYGPGDSRLDHTPDEHVELDEVRLAAGVLEAVLRRIVDCVKLGTEHSERAKLE